MYIRLFLLRLRGYSFLNALACHVFTDPELCSYIYIYTVNPSASAFIQLFAVWSRDAHGLVTNQPSYRRRVFVLHHSQLVILQSFSLATMAPVNVLNHLRTLYTKGRCMFQIPASLKSVPH